MMCRIKYIPEICLDEIKGEVIVLGEDNNYILLSILQSFLWNSYESRSLMSGEVIPRLMRFVSMYDIAHLVSLSLMNNEFATDEVKS